MLKQIRLRTTRDSSTKLFGTPRGPRPTNQNERAESTFLIKINGKIQKKLRSRALRARGSIKKRSRFLKIKE